MPSKPAHTSAQAERQAAESGSTAPTQLPPMTMVAAEDRPRELTASEAALSARSAQAEAMPTLEPPQTNGAAAENASTWVASKTVNALWINNANRNSWVSITGVGWKKLSAASDTGIMALTMLLSQARQTGATINYREEADGMIHEVYLW